ncbi:MAG TPA: acetyl-CoA C-acyltransferase [Bacteroidetes bacterium]|nr:acetyl-CoA C-acyltransferase [Bacteroidota bacterium]
MSKEVYIVAGVRTPIGSFNGSLAKVSATKLGAAAIQGALEKSGIKAENIDEVYMGNVLSANLGQAPARQAAIFAGIPNTVPCTTVNKVCASGMKAIMLAANAIRLGEAQVVVAGGMENMSKVPHYISTSRTGIKLGHGQLTDGMLADGLWDVYNDYHMGNAAELCADTCNITREMQDEFTHESYKRSQAAIADGKFKDEIVPVTIPQRRGDAVVVDTDEEPARVKFEKINSLRPVFKKDGTVTAANASTINDGAAALILASGEAVEKLGLKPIARLLGQADAAKAPEWFTTAPSEALPKALDRAGLTKDQIDAWEINQAFAVVSLANAQELDLDPAKVDQNGGGVSLGHPLGASGARIVVTLMSVLGQTAGKYGAAGICNGGGGASALVIEKM